MPDTFRLHVSPNGNDRWSGRLAKPNARGNDGPMATLEAARNALRKSPASIKKRIVVHSGEYFDVSLRLGPQDSGLTIEAAAGETPVIYGARRITNWKKSGPRFYAADLKGVTEGKWDFRHLLVNGVFAPRAILPARGHLSHENVWDVWVTADGDNSRWAREPTSHELTHMVFRKGDIPRSLDLRNAEFTVCHWSDDSIVKAQHIDWKTRTITFASPCLYPPGATQHMSERRNWYSIANVREGISEPGQWYLDRARGRLVYWPRKGEEMSSLEVIAPTVCSILRIAGHRAKPVHDVTVRGLSFRATTAKTESPRWGGWYMDGAVSVTGPAERIVLRDLSFEHIGGTAVTARRSVQKKYPKPDSGRQVSQLKVRNCRFTNCAGPAIYAWADQCHIDNNLIRNIGLDCIGAVAICVDGIGGRITHNEIETCPYVGIAVGGSGGQIEFNRIREYMLGGDDGGAIYLYGRSKRYRCRHNLVYANDTRNLAPALYCDEMSEGHLLEGNLVIGGHWVLHLHNCQRHVLRNNLLVTDKACKITFMRSRHNVFDKNVVVAGGDVVLHMIPGLSVDSMRHNIFHARKGDVQAAWLARYSYDPTHIEPLPVTQKNVIADPKLARRNPEACVFLAGSPARELGIKPFDASKAGRRRSRSKGRA